MASTLCKQTAQGAHFPSSGAAAPGVITTTLIPCINYSADATDEARWIDVMAEDYAAGTLTLEVLWCPATATGSSNVRWDAKIWRLVDSTDVMSTESFASVNSVSSAEPGVAREIVYASITLTNDDGIAAGDGFILSILRDHDWAGAGPDAMAGDAQLLAWQIKE